MLSQSSEGGPQIKKSPWKRLINSELISGKQNVRIGFTHSFTPKASNSPNVFFFLPPTQVSTFLWLPNISTYLIHTRVQELVVPKLNCYHFCTLKIFHLTSLGALLPSYIKYSGYRFFPCRVKAAWKQYLFLFSQLSHLILLSRINPFLCNVASSLVHSIGIPLHFLMVQALRTMPGIKYLFF